MSDKEKHGVVPVRVPANAIRKRATTPKGIGENDSYNLSTLQGCRRVFTQVLLADGLSKAAVRD